MGWKEEDKGEEGRDEKAEEMTVEEAGKETGEEAAAESLTEERRKAVVDMEGRTERKLPVSCCRSHIEPKQALPRVRTIRKGAKRYEARREVVVAAVADGAETVCAVGPAGAAPSDMMKEKHAPRKQGCELSWRCKRIQACSTRSLCLPGSTPGNTVFCGEEWDDCEWW